MMDPSKLSELSAAQKILVAIQEDADAGDSSIRDVGHSSWTSAQITVLAWKLDPQCFGLTGYEHAYPCTNKSYAILMGSKSIVAKGLLEFVGDRRYVLTANGSKTAKEILAGENKGKRVKDFSQEKFPHQAYTGLLRMIASTGYHLYLAKNGPGITWGDARVFLGIGTETLQAAVGIADRADHHLSLAKDWTATRPIRGDDGREIDAKEIEALENCNTYIRKLYRIRLERLFYGRVAPGMMIED